jgi:hypothetical protein
VIAVGGGVAESTCAENCGASAAPNATEPEALSRSRRDNIGFFIVVSSSFACVVVIR